MASVSMSGPKTPKTLLRKSNPHEEDGNQNITVYVRCRPITEKEKKSVVEVIPEQKTIRVNDYRSTNGTTSLSDKYFTRNFCYDNVFGPKTPQLSVYKAVVSPLIEQVLDGYNCTVFAYGQTGTGKTYTMEGERTSQDLSWEDDPLSGIIPRALHHLFETLTAQKCEYTVRVSFLEMYNEELYDLLSAIDDTTKLKIYDNTAAKGSVIIGGLQEITVQTKAEIYDILRKGSAKRQTASTLLNACSSRSHTIFSVTVHVKENTVDGEELVKIGKLNLVDLAGSENIGRSGALDKRAREAGNINQSLLTLGRVITSLVEKGPHVPYRESKLTRLLQDSLGGRTKTSIIATVSPNIADAEDTLSTLEYAQRAKKITNKPEVNQKLSKKTLLKEYTAEIERLRKDLLACREKTGIYVNQENYVEMTDKLDTQAKEIETKLANIRVLEAELANINSLFEVSQGELEKKTEKLIKTRTDLKNTKKSLKNTVKDLVEHKYLVDVHENTEKELSTQAKELLSTADSATNDNAILHSKIDRFKNVEIINFKNLTSFTTKFDEKMNELEKIIDTGSETLHESLSNMQVEAQKNLKSSNKILNGKVTVNMHDTETSVNDFISNISTRCFKDNEILESSGFLTKGIEKIGQNVSSVNDELLEQFCNIKTFFEEGIQGVIECVHEERSEIENMLMTQNNHITKLSEYRKHSIEEMLVKINGVFQEQSKTITGLKSKVEKLEEENKQSRDSSRDEIDSALEILQNLRKTRFSEETEDECASQYHELKRSCENASKDIEDKKKELGNSLQNCSLQLKIREGIAFDYINDLDDVISNKTQVKINKLAEMSEKDKLLFESAADTLTNGQNVVEKEIESNIAMNERTLIMIRKNMQESALDLANMKSNFKEKIDGLKIILEDELPNKIATDMGDVIHGVDTVGRILNTWHRTYQRHIASRCSDQNEFSSSMHKCSVTGVTPQKMEYSYPRDLTTTENHTKLLEHFRASQPMLDETLEMDTTQEVESRIDVSGKDISVQSTDSNLENVGGDQSIQSSIINAKNISIVNDKPKKHIKSFKKEGNKKPLGLKSNN